MDLCGQNRDEGKGSTEGGKARKAGAPTSVMVLNAEPRLSRSNVARNVYVSCIRAGGEGGGNFEAERPTGNW